MKVLSVYDLLLLLLISLFSLLSLLLLRSLESSLSLDMDLYEGLLLLFRAGDLERDLERLLDPLSRLLLLSRPPLPPLPPLLISTLTLRLDNISTRRRNIEGKWKYLGQLECGFNSKHIKVQNYVE